MPRAFPHGISVVDFHFQTKGESAKLSFPFLVFFLGRNRTNPKIKGAVVFHEQGPQSFDYSIRLNHTWAFSGFPDVKNIMDTNGPFLNDLSLGVNTIPILQYGLSGFLTVRVCYPLCYLSDSWFCYLFNLFMFRFYC